MKHFQNGSQSFRSGRPRKIDDYTKRIIIRSASNSTKSAARFIQENNLNVCERTVQLVLNESGVLKYMKKMHKPPLTA